MAPRDERGLRPQTTAMNNQGGGPGVRHPFTSIVAPRRRMEINLQKESPMAQGNQPINLDVALERRGEERSAVLQVFLRDGELDEDEMAFLELHDQGTSWFEQVLQCIWTGMSWFRCLDPRKGNHRTRDLTAQYVGRYGGPIAAD